MGSISLYYGVQLESWFFNSRYIITNNNEDLIESRKFKDQALLYHKEMSSNQKEFFEAL